MTSKQVNDNQIGAEQIVSLAFSPPSESESEDARLFRRLLWREVQGIIREDSKNTSSDLDNPNDDDYESIIAKVEEVISKDKQLGQELTELVEKFLEEKSSLKKSPLVNVSTLTLTIVGSLAIIGGFVSGIPGAIVGAGTSPLFVKLIEERRINSQKSKTSQGRGNSGSKV
ncbi:MAG: hypothetical protein AB4057_08580 [Crocosphaera sp.]